MRGQTFYPNLVQTSNLHLLLIQIPFGGTSFMDVGTMKLDRVQYLEEFPMLGFCHLAVLNTLWILGSEKYVGDLAHQWYSQHPWPYPRVLTTLPLFWPSPSLSLQTLINISFPHTSMHQFTHLPLHSFSLIPSLCLILWLRQVPSSSLIHSWCFTLPNSFTPELNLLWALLLSIHLYPH